MVPSLVNGSYSYLLLPLRRMTALNDHIAGRLAAARLVAQGLLTPRSARRLSHTVTATVTTTVRVVNSVHNHAANARANTHVALAASLTNLNILVLFVANNAHAGGALQAHQANFAAGQTHLGVVALFGH